MRISLAFKTPNGDNRVSRIIAERDAPFRYCHAALIFGVDMVFESHFKTGVRFNRYVPDPARWTVVPVPVLAGEDEKIREFCELHAGDDYDTCGVLDLGGMPFVKQCPDKWFCSEIALAAVQQVGILVALTPHMTTPNGLFDACRLVGLLDDQNQS